MDVYRICEYEPSRTRTFLCSFCSPRKKATREFKNAEDEMIRNVGEWDELKWGERSKKKKKQAWSEEHLAEKT